MSRIPTTLALLLTAVLAALLLLPGRALAEDAVPEDSAAARLFREAWWSETGAGALDKALEAYRKAVSAEGGKPIRARAQYRMALVLQRMGRTEEAVRALESLTKDFGDQAELLIKARQRLDEWTAEDLRESFGDWYRRYQYSPEFQSKIVNLILKLGGPDDKVATAAREELLTIGEPALPALREHTASANGKLRIAAVALMIELGALPEPAALFAATRWESSQKFWKLLTKIEGVQRDTYVRTAAEMEDDWRASWIAAALRGPEAMLDVVSAETDSSRNVTYYFLPAILELKPSTQVFERLRALVLDEGVKARVRGGAAAFLANRHEWESATPDPTGLTEADVLAWASADDAFVRDVAWTYLAQGRLRTPGAWRVAAKAVLDEPVGSGRVSSYSRALAALLGQLRRASPDDDLEPAVAAVVHSLKSRSLQSSSLGALRADFGDGSSVVPRHVVAKALGRAKGQFLANAVRTYWHTVKQDQAEMDTLIAWIRDAEEGLVQREAILQAATEIRSGVGRLMEPFESEKFRFAMRDILFQSLQSNRALEALDWDLDSLTLLVQTANTEKKKNTGPRRGTRSWVTNRAGVQIRRRTALRNEISLVFFRLLSDDAIRAQLFEAAFTYPEKFTPDVWLLLGEDWSQVAENRGFAIDSLIRGWSTWKPEQRRAGLTVFLDKQLVGNGDPRLTTFVRERLAQESLDAATRSVMIAALPDLVLRDVQAAFDFESPAEAEFAVDLIHRLPVDEETYDAFAKMLQPDASRTVAWEIYAHFSEAPESRVHDLIRRLLLVRKGVDAESNAVSLLQGRKNAEDLPLWRVALTHWSSDVRKSAAEALGNLYDEASIKALAKAVDDPDPQVRDAALKSLERIERIEKQKDRWRKFAEGLAPAPGK